MKIKYLLILVSVLLAGCLGPVKTTTVSRYSLIPDKKTVPIKRSHVSSSVLVSETQAEPGYTSSNMVYVMIPYKLRSYANNAWVAPPATMFNQILASSLRGMGYFHAVINGPFSGYSEYILYSNILTLQQEFINPVSQVRLSVFASLLDTKTNKIVASKTFNIEVPSPENNPYSGVLAANVAANTIANKIALFISQSVH